MATAAPTKPNPAASRDAAVEQVISTAANRVRLNDLFTGAAAAAVLALGYLCAMVVLDKLFALPDWVRQLGLLGFLGGLAAVGYFLIVRPMRRRVNPRYVARQIEATLPDAKNVLINWVDLQDEPLPGSVKAAVGANAAEGVAEADVETATSSRRVVWLGAAAGVLVAALAVLFLVFSGPQFLSLVRRAVVPFQPAEIASQTTITLDEPADGDATVTDGQPLSIAVTLTGRLPDPNGPDKPRLLVRYNPDSDEVVELPLTPAGSAREFRTDLGRGTILNGFWYRVAAGDARTPEYRVTVRTRPMLSEFKAVYEYPAYLKWPADAEEGNPKLRAFRGTVVTLTAKANRPLTGATLTTTGNEGGREVVRGEVVGDARDRLKFQVKLAESGTYRIEFKTATGEGSFYSADYPVEVEVDAGPTVTITAPKEDEVQLPLNGLLAVDGTITDDHGIAGVELRFKLGDRELKPKAFRDGKPLVREKDNTLLTEVPDYKDSVKLDALTDADGKPVVLKEDDVLEYWLAATDNCTEPAANVGESARKRVRLTPAVQEPEKRQEQANREQQRKQDEQKGEQKRDERLKKETRPEDQNRNTKADRQPSEQNPESKDPNNTDPMKGDGQKPENPPEGDPNDPNKGSGEKPNDQDVQNQAQDLQDKINKQKEQQKHEAGDARGDGDPSQGAETKPSSEPKPQDAQPNGDGQKDAAQEKGGPPPENAGKPEGNPSESKDGGKLTDPQRSEQKPEPKPDAKGEQKPTGEQPKNAPKEGTEAGGSKESKEGTPPPPMNPNEKPDGKKDGSASAGRGAEPPKDPNAKPQDPMGGGNDTGKPDDKKVDPKDLSGSKPKGEPTRGDTKPEPKGGSDAQQPDQKQDAGGAKGEAPPKPAGSKDTPPKGDGSQPMPPKQGPPADAGSEKEPPKEQPTPDGKGGAAEPKGEGKTPEKPTGDPKDPMGSGKGEDEKGTAKPSNTDPPKKGDGSGKPDEKDPKSPPNGSGKPDEKDPKTQPNGGAGEKKLDPKEVEQAVKDLESKDEKTKQTAQEKLDKAVGKENREQIEKLQKDLKSDDPAARQAAEQKLEEMKKEAQKNAQKGDGQPQPKELTEQEKKELAEAAKNLDSKDEKTRKEAQEKLDKAVGKENREQLEQMKKDLNSDDKAVREAAEKKLQDMAKQAQQQQGKGETPQPRELTDAEKKELADAAQKLNSKDDAERKAAEQKLDEAIGKQNREELQQDLKDLQGNDQAKAEQARQKLERKVEEAKKNGKDSHDDRSGNLGGGNNKTPGKPIEGNLENQLKSRELALDDFKKYRGDKQFLKENNLTEEQYDKFLKEYEAGVDRLRDEVANRRVNPPADPTGTPTIRNDGSTDRVKGRTDADKLQGSSGPGKPPPGFEDAQKRFAAEAAKRDPNKQK